MQDKYVSAAIRIGNQICRDAFRHNGKCTWVACTTEPDGQAQKPYYHALKGDWYAGTSGIAYFLAHLYSRSRSEIHKQVAREAIQQALDTAQLIQHGKTGFHSGLTGIAYAAIAVGEQTDTPALISEGLSMIKKIGALHEKEYSLDVIDGCAGAIPAIVKIARRYPSEALLELLRKMSGFLLANMKKEPVGYSWDTFPGGTTSNLTGYAHGASGVASALLEIWNLTGDTACLDAAMGGFAYEESHFVAGEKNWPDFRDYGAITQTEPTGPVCGCAWCHGAPGIGLSRIRAFELTQNPVFQQYARYAMDTTLKTLQPAALGNFSLCHGMAGNADLMLYASKVFQTPEHLAQAEAVGDTIIAEYMETGIPIPNGTQTDYTTPDLMLGLAGIGYFLLRLTDPLEFDSVLVVS